MRIIHKNEIIKTFFLFTLVLYGLIKGQCVPPDNEPPCPNCANIGFDLGNTSGWVLTTGTVDDGNSTDCSAIPACSPSPSWSGAGTLAPLNDPTTCGESDRFTLYNDPNAIDQLVGDPCLTVVSPLGGYSIKLGNATNGCGAEKIEYTMVVDSCNAFFQYAYAVVLHNPSGHPCNAQPFFSVSLLDQNGNLLQPFSCAEYATSALCATGWKQTNKCGDQVKYKCWTVIGVNLMPYLGQTIKIKVEVHDCSYCGHFGYAYFDAQCGKMKINQLICPGSPIAVLQAPPGFQTYQWYDPSGNPIPGATQPTLTVNNPQIGDIYSVQVAYTPDCPSTLYTQLQYTDPQFVPVVKPSECSYTVSGTMYCAPPPYTYLWDNGQTDSIATYLTPGVHFVTVIGGGGCGDTVQFTIPDFGLNASIISFTNPTCQGASNGSATVGISKGKYPYSYIWSNGQADSIATGLSAGIYYVTVKDSLGCSQVLSVQLDAPPPLQVSLSTTPIGCNGNNDGVAKVESVSGGTSPYSYLWDNGSTNQTASNLSAGNHYVTITDANGCSITTVVYINQPPPLQLAGSSIQNVKCAGDCNGSITVSAIGGTPPYSYTWNTMPIQLSNIATGLCPGSYTVSIKDNKNCQITSTYTITEPPPLSINMTNGNSYCSTNNGFAQANPSGGTPPYSYLWNNGQTTQQINGLSTGTYYVTVKDVNGCIITGATSVVTYPPVSIQIQSLSMTCPDNCNGMANVLPSGGTPPFTYTWSNGETGPQITGLCQGIYCVTVVDVYGCSDYACATINAPPPLSLTTSPDTQICIGGSAILSAYPSGGDPPYTIIWSNGATNQSILVSPQQPTCYQVSITDSKGCKGPTKQVCVNFPPPLSIIANPPYTIICPGNSASFTAYAWGGSGLPINYTWSNGYIGSTINITPSGTYPDTIIYYVTASDGCALPAYTQVSVIFRPKPVPLFTTDTTQGCVPLNIKFTSQSQNAQQCIWMLGDGNTHIGCQSFTHTYTNPGSYDITLIVINSEGCSDTLVVPNYIHAYAIPIADFTYYPPSSIALSTYFDFYENVISQDPVQLYQWIFYINDIPSDTLYGPQVSYVFPPQANTYPVQLQVWTIYKCYDDITKPLTIEPFYTLWIPNVFTPNGDGVNDYFIPDGIPVDPNDFVMYIFDRWGEVIYKTNSMDKPWDGIAHEKNGSKVCQEGVYVWLIITRNPEKPDEYLKIIGHVSLLR